MKRQFEYKEGRTHLFWEIERNDSLLTNRSWGRSRPEVIRVRRFRSEAAAERGYEEKIESRLADGYVEMGPGANKAEPRPILEGPKAVAAAKEAIISTTVPTLRKLGFQGTFPRFRRIEKDRHSVVWFGWGKGQGRVSVGLGIVPPKKETTVAEDVRRAINIRNRQRTMLRDLVPHRDWKLFSFDLAAAKWGPKWPQPLASLLRKALETRGLAWLRDPARRPGR